MIFDSTARHIAGSFSGIHQLLPSEAYSQLSLTPAIVERGWDFDGDGTKVEDYDYQNFIDAINRHYGIDKQNRQVFKPGDEALSFHAYPGGTGKQDDWREDVPSDVSYHHLVGWGREKDTIERLEARTVVKRVLTGFVITRALNPVRTYGDGTVPLVSASRRGRGQDLNAPSATVIFFRPKPEDEDSSSVEHLALTQNPQVLATIDSLLGLGGLSYTAAVQATEVVAREYMTHEVLIVGGENLAIRDLFGHNTAQTTGGYEGEVPGVDHVQIAEDVFSLLLESGIDFTVDFHTSDWGFLFESKTATADRVTSLLRYEEPGLPPGTPVRAIFDAAGLAGVYIDRDGDQLFEETLIPVDDVADPAGVDTDPPLLTVRKTPVRAGVYSITAEASDQASGVREILYSVDDSPPLSYFAPIEVDSPPARQVSIVVFDNVGNRSGEVVLLARNGDANGDGQVTVSDIFYLINHLFASGPGPVGEGDANGDSQVSVSDIFYLINYLFAGGPAPIE